MGDGNFTTDYLEKLDPRELLGFFSSFVFFSFSFLFLFFFVLLSFLFLFLPNIARHHTDGRHGFLLGLAEISDPLAADQGQGDLVFMCLAGKQDRKLHGFPCLGLSGSQIRQAMDSVEVEQP